MKVLPPPLFAMISMFASPKLGSNGENGTICRDDVSSKIADELNPCHGSSAGNRSAACSVKHSSSRFVSSDIPGSVPM